MDAASGSNLRGRFFWFESTSGSPQNHFSMPPRGIYGLETADASGVTQETIKLQLEAVYIDGILHRIINMITLTIRYIVRSIIDRAPCFTTWRFVIDRNWSRGC